MTVSVCQRPSWLRFWLLTQTWTSCVKTEAQVHAVMYCCVTLRHIPHPGTQKNPTRLQCVELASKFSPWIWLCWTEMCLWSHLRNRVYVRSPVNGVNMKDPASKKSRTHYILSGSNNSTFTSTFYKGNQEGLVRFYMETACKDTANEVKHFHEGFFLFSINL